MKTITRQLLLTVIALLLITTTANSQCSPPVHFGMMVHLEDNWDDNVNIASFNNHALQLRMAVGFVKPYGAKFTAESAIPFAEGCINWGDNVLQSLIDSTMGVGSHSNASSDYAYTKSLIDGLVGASENRGVSGGWGQLDNIIPNNWADSANVAGFSYINAATYFTYLQIPQNERPGSVTDAMILDSLYHNPVPPDFDERVHPHRINSAFTWHIDTTGPILLLTGSLGEISSIAEGRENCFPTCILDSADVDTILVYINQAINIAQTTNKFTVVYLHTPLYTYTPATKPFYDYLFQSLMPLVATGDIEYKTMGEIYDSFIQCESLTSVAKENLDNNIKIFPNPSTDILNIDFHNFNDRIFSVEIIDVLGQVVFKQINSVKNQESILTIDLTQQINGIYFVKVRTAKETITKKMIKQ